MQKVTLQIETSYESETVTVKDEVSIGRTSLADIELDDPGLSRVNTTFFRDEGDVLVVDENSSNGTFLNGEKLGREPRVVFDGDRIKMGGETEVRVSIGEAAPSRPKPERKPRKKRPKTARASAAPSTVRNYTPDIQIDKPAPSKEKIPTVLIVAAFATFGIVFFALIGILLVNYFEDGGGQASKRPIPKRNRDAVIPIRVIDPLGGQEQKGLDELVQFWEVQEEEIKVEDMQEIAADTTATSDPGFNLKVSLDFWKKQYDLSRKKHYGNSPPGLKNFKALCCGVPKQTRKIAEMQRRSPPYKIPMDFADLARKRMANQLIELPMATEYWVLDVGGSSNEKPFTTFDFKTGVQEAKPGTDDYLTLAQLAANFSGEKYDMNNPKHRRQMKIRLLRMFHPRARPILEQLAKAFHARFKKPLRITSLSRSMEYQIGLNKFNPNSFRVRGAGSLPPHTSGCAFDLSRKFNSAEEQNFLQEMLVQMEDARQLDGLREGGTNACFHVFIYDDGAPPAGF